MDWNLKKMWPAAAASLVAFTSILNAADEAQVKNIENRVCNLEKSCPTGCLNPNARPQVQCGYNIFLEADLLWWSVYEHGLDFAIKGANIDGTSSINDGESTDVGNDYSWGFRFAVGYNTPHDGWDLRGSWAFFRNEVNDAERANNNGGLFPVWVVPLTKALPTAGNYLYASKADSKWETELNIIDLELGREFFTSKYLTLRPHMGLRYVRLDQKYHVAYEGGSLFPSSNAIYSIHNSNDFWGFGLRGGFDTQWGLTNGFSIYGNFALALLHGHFHITQETFTKTKGTAAITPRFDNNVRKRVGRATTDLALGIRWDAMFNEDRFHLGLQLGWEHHMFFGQNQMWIMSNSNQNAPYSKGNDELTTQGWTLSARFDF